MSSKNEIIHSIREQGIEKFEMPDLDNLCFLQEDKDNEKWFIESCELVGGQVVCLNKENNSLHTIIKELYPQVKSIASNLNIDGMETINPDEYDTPHQLDHIDLAIINGEFGVAENGAVWIEKQTRYRALYFIAENLIILLDRSRLVSTMHEAYQLLDSTDYEYGVFISGPSKTADIEQSLVVGAHGAKSVTVVLYDKNPVTR